MASDRLLKAIKEYKDYANNHGIDESVINAFIEAGKVALQEQEKEMALDLTKRAKDMCRELVTQQTGGTLDELQIYGGEHQEKYNIVELYFKALQVEAPYLVDSFFEYIEIDENEPLKRFYFPRKRILRPVIEAYQEVYDGKLDFLSVSQPKRTGKTTSGLKFCEMLGGRTPSGSIFATGKGEGLVKRFYGGLLDMFEDDMQYARFLSVFPKGKKANSTYKSAENLSIDLWRKNVFPTFTCRPIDGAIVGCTEANLLVYIDDCVKNHEEARNRDRLEFLCEKVTDDVLGRRIEGTPIIIQGTKYSLYDPITALQEKADLLGWRWKEVAIPALDPVTDESNWEITLSGNRKVFTTDYYRKERMLVTEETWAAEFQQEPFEAKGRMFPKDKLNRYRELPVDVEPDAIMAACDSADRGEDYCSMPIGYVYGDKIFIHDVVFDNSGTEFTKPECAKKLIQNNVKTVVFESNAAGRYFGKDVMELVKNGGGRCSDRYKYNRTNKITRMENARDNIIRDYYFLEEDMYDRGSQYDLFMKNLTTMTRSGKVKHDDAPDSLALFENEMRNGASTVQAINNPFRSGGWL